MKIAIIAAMSKNRVIGRNNKMPWHLPEDLKFFKKTTSGSPIIMGRNTYESLGRPLPHRVNIVLSADEDFHPAHGVIVAAGLSQAFSIAEKCAEESGADTAFVIGGGQVYEQALDKADELILTTIDKEVEGDAFFPEIPAYWGNAVEREPHVSANGIKYSIARYKRAGKKAAPQFRARDKIDNGCIARVASA